MNNSESFIQKINEDYLINAVVRFFDEIMVLYNLIGSRDISSINMKDDSTASFSINTDSYDSALRIYEELNNSSFTVYEKIFNISVSSLENNSSSIIITVSRALS